MLVLLSRIHSNAARASHIPPPHPVVSFIPYPSPTVLTHVVSHIVARNGHATSFGAWWRRGGAAHHGVGPRRHRRAALVCRVVRSRPPATSAARWQRLHGLQDRRHAHDGHEARGHRYRAVLCHPCAHARDGPFGHALAPAARVRTRTRKRQCVPENASSRMSLAMAFSSSMWALK